CPTSGVGAQSPKSRRRLHRVEPSQSGGTPALQLRDSGPEALDPRLQLADLCAERGLSLGPGDPARSNLGAREPQLEPPQARFNGANPLLQLGEASLNVREPAFDAGESPLDVRESPFDVGQAQLDLRETPLEVSEPHVDLGEPILDPLQATL